MLGAPFSRPPHPHPPPGFCLQIDHLQALKAYEFRVRAFLEEELKQEAGRSPGAQACSRLAEGPWSLKLMVNHSPPASSI